MTAIGRKAAIHARLNSVHGPLAEWQLSCQSEDPINSVSHERPPLQITAVAGDRTQCVMYGLRSPARGQERRVRPQQVRSPPVRLDLIP